MIIHLNTDTRLLIHPDTSTKEWKEQKFPTIEIRVCDKCGGQEDDEAVTSIISYNAGGINMDLHKRCITFVEARLKMALGLKTFNDLEVLAKNGRYNSLIPTNQ